MKVKSAMKTKLGGYVASDGGGGNLRAKFEFLFCKFK